MINISFEENKAATMCYIPLVFVLGAEKTTLFLKSEVVPKILEIISLSDKIHVKAHAWRPKYHMHFCLTRSGGVDF